MSHPVILDACTIINLLRIDDENEEFLYNHIIGLNLHVAKKVHEEVKTNFNKNPLSENQQEYIDRCIVRLYNDLIPQNKIYTNEDIIKNITRKLFEELKTYGDKSYQKENGELFSTALGLIVSRSEDDKIWFYTDDKPATEYFMPYFCYQQIGTIMDTVDLLIYLYWTSPDFDKKRLEKYLQDLYSDINQPLKRMINEVQKIKDSFSNNNINNGLRRNVNDLIDSYYNLDIPKMENAIEAIKSSYTSSKVATVISKYGNLLINSPLIIRICKTKKDLNKYVVFKLK